MALEGLKEAINPDPSLDLGWREAQAQNVVADTARGLRGARGLEAGQLLRVRGGVRERGRESEGEVNGEGERVKKWWG